MKKKIFRTSDECKNRWNLVLNSEYRPWLEIEDEVLINLSAEHSAYGAWTIIAGEMNFNGFERDHESCRKRWKIVQPQRDPRRWSDVEDRELLNFTKEYTNETNKYWEQIAEAMVIKGIHVTAVDCRDRYYHQRAPDYSVPGAKNLAGAQGRR